ncbi:hypothetical protein ACTJJ0_05085 [Chitinophaga sp. 22321]|uniref:LysM domain-containing protein n=1 Tax=Chitinophaga hostae TaxID=2831022 RepID=A0ABS5IZI9_9BACT|nr:hypothetical protein [Chitinophaga hostae]MBS0028370.1 hypothetical protein [Chitinophaga hostae]
MFEKVFNKIRGFFDPYWDFQMAGSLRAFFTYLNAADKNPVIRMWVDDSPGNGHQGSTVGILRQLVNNVVPDNGFGFSGTIEVYYGPGEDKDPTLPKLFNLLPELRGQHTGEINNAQIRLIECKEKTPAPKPIVNLGFTGGADEGEDDGKIIPQHFAKRLNVRFFLRLQPYRWGAPEQIQLLTSDKPISLTAQSVLGYSSFNQRAFYIRTPIAVPRWDLYANTPYKAQAEIIEWLTAMATELDFAPVYGIRTSGNMQLAKTAQDRMFEVVTGMLASQRSEGRKRPGAKPIIVVSCDIFVDGIRPTTVAGSLSILVDGGPTEPEASAMTDLRDGGWFSGGQKIEVSEEDQKRNKELVQQYEVRAAYLRNVNSMNRVRYVWKPDSVMKVRAEMNWLSGSSDRLLFIQLGRIPQPLYSYLLQKATLPPVFEGQGTASTTLNIGNYYLHVARPGSTVVQFPTTIIGHKDDHEDTNIGDFVFFDFYPSVPKNIQEIANEINRPLHLWPKDAGINPAERVGKFIKDYKQGNTGGYRKYFEEVAAFYQNIDNDKFRYGASFLNHVIAKEKQVLSFKAAGKAGDNDEPVLTQLLSSLQQHLSPKKVLQLIPGTLDSGAIYDFYIDLLGTENPFVIDQAEITPQYDKDNVIISILVVGTTAALGAAQAVNIVFTAPEAVITGKVRFTFEDTWAPDLIPWIQFSNPYIELYTINAKTISYGAVGGKIDTAGLELSLQLPVRDGKWQFIGNFQKPYPGISRAFQLAGGIDLTQVLPPPFDALADFGLENTQLVCNTITKQVEYIGFGFSTNSSFRLLPNLVLENIKATVIVQDPGSVANRNTDWSLYGTFKIGSRHDAGIVALGGMSPGLTFNGSLQSGTIQFTDLLSVFLPGMDISLPQQPSITAFNATFNIKDTSLYTISCKLNIDWPFKISGVTALTINDVGIDAQSQSTGLSMAITGAITILPDTPSAFGLGLSAAYYSEKKNWRFLGQQTSGKVKLIELLKYYTGWDTDFEINIDDLLLQMETLNSSWEFSGKTADPIKIPGVDLSLNLHLKIGYNGGTKSFGGRETITGKAIVPILLPDHKIVSLASLLQEDPAIGHFGTGQADITWQNIDITVYYDFAPGYKSFGIKWGQLEGKIIQSGTPQKTIATLSFTQSTTIGSMVETMMEWATGSKFSLGAPWNILDSIALNNLLLTFNFTDKQVGLEIVLDPVEIGVFGINIATITGFKLSYNSGQADPKQNGVQVQLQGNFKWQEDPNKPLGWDASKPETTPAPPAQGNKYVDLRLLAMGQHVEVKGLSTATSVAEAIAIMEKLPDTPTGKIPPVELNANNGWLIGMDLGLLRISTDAPPKSLLTAAAGQGVLAVPDDYVFNLQVVFADPDLYGLRIALNGDAAKVFKGLQFEIMYRQISQSVGVYQSEITLPDVMRYISLGQFNIVLPVFGIQVYTNGDFQVDLGFPWNANFSRSFTLQTIIYVPVPIPVMGSIGLYFANLSSATTTKVPASKKGIFNPVVAFGVGFQIGLGYEFNIGILRAGFSLTVAAIIEGVIAKWNPYLPATAGQRDRLETDYYFSIRGTVGIIGKLYGTVDFAIIKASLNIEISIIAQFYFAPYEPIALALVANVTASASIKILFITISFSFSLRIEHHLTLPAVGGTAPWFDEAEKISLSQSRRLERAEMAVRLLQHKLLATNVALNWNNLLPAATPVELQVYLVPGLTAALDENEKTPTLAGQKACGVAVMMMESVKAPQDDPISCRLKAVDPVTDSAFEKIAKQVFRWVIAALQSNPLTEKEVDRIVVTREQLEAVLARFSAANNDIPVPEADINTFMERQFNVVVTGMNKDTDGTEMNATYFPIQPSVGFSLQRPGAPEPLAYTYATYNATSTDYLAALRAYFNEMGVNAASNEKVRYENFSLNDDDGPSVGSFIFSDYYALLAKQMLQMAVNSLDNYVYPIQPVQCTGDIVNWVNQTGNLANGQEYTLEKLFTDNKSHEVNVNSIVAIAGTKYVVQTNDTFASIASLEIYTGGFTAQSLAQQNIRTGNLLKAGLEIIYTGKPPYPILPQQTMEDIAKAMDISTDELLQNSNIVGLKDLLIPASTLSLPIFNYKTKEKDNLDEIAAKFGTTQEQLGSVAANGKIKDLFAATANPDLNIVQLPQFQVAALLQEIQHTQGLQHLAGLTSRYYMAGLRLPTKGLQPKYPGMWVTGEKNAYHLPGSAGLFALSGQQFPIPELATGESVVLTFTNNGCKWISFDKQAALSIVITPESVQYKQAVALTAFATKNYLDVGLMQLGTQEPFTIEANTYTFNSNVNWASPSNVKMPYPGNIGAPQQLSLWKIPDSLLNLPDLTIHKINPRMSIQLGAYNEAAQKMEYNAFNDYGWGTQIDFTIRKISPIPGSPTTDTTYEVLGADGFNTLLLEKLVDQIGDNNNLIDSFHIAYTQSTDKTAGSGIQTDNPDQLTIGLAQVNLTTVTAPDLPAAMKDDEQVVVQQLVTPTKFIRLLWEASITSQGGFYLYYYNDNSKGGFPDRIFDDQDNARISLLVLFSDVQRNQLCSYMNVLATASAVDFSSHTLFAKTWMQDLQITADNATSFAGIAGDYFADMDQVAANNKDIPLRSNAVLALNGGVYEVRDKAPGWKLNDIAGYFEVTPEAVKAANPQISNWDTQLPVFTVIYLPNLSMVVGVGKGGNTLGDIAGYFNISVSGIALANKDVPGVFAPGKVIEFTSGPLTNKSTIRQDEAAVKAVRKVAEPVPYDPADKDFASKYLQNTFSLLGYQVSENAFFRSSNISLPLCPVIPGTTAMANSKFVLPPKLSVDDVWQYTDSLAFTHLVKKVQQTKQDLPDPENDPYQGLGSLLQISYSWQDVYGNALLTTLDNLQDGNNPNNFPILIKYYDTLVGLSKWPAVSSNWEVTKIGDQPVLNLILNFDATAYDGLLIVRAGEGNTLTAVFTTALDEVSATAAANYSFSDHIQIVTISLNADKKSVLIKVRDLLPGIQIILQVKDILNQEKNKTYTGSASFSTNPAIASTSTIVSKAAGDKLLYEQIWYQLNDKNGIQLMANTSLVPDKDFIPDAAQTDALVQKWLAPIYKYVDSRAKAQDTAILPDLQHMLTFTVDPAAIETKDVFKLSFDFTIRRIRQDLAGSSNDAILMVSTTIAPLSDLSANNGNNYTKFITDFETTFSGKMELRIAGGVDRFDSIVAADSTLWVVRLDKTNTGPIPALGFAINKLEEPKLFAPRPVANELISRTGVQICPFDPKTGLDCENSIYKDFIGVDINGWCKQVFESFDDLLSPAFVTCIQIVDAKNKKENPSAPLFFDLLISQKGQLADILKDLMVPVFEDQAGVDPTDIREDFKQALLVKLSNAYSVLSGFRFSANVYNNNLDAPAYLYGNVTQKDDSGEVRAGQNIQFSAAKISLAPDTQAGVSFLMSSPQIIKGQQGEVLPVLDLNLSYAVSAIEHQIGELPGIKGYKASSWLQFFSKDSSILSAQSLSDKVVRVPLPFNIFPEAPGMTKQNGQLSINVGGVSLSDLLDWDYLFSYSQSFHYPQDMLHFNVRFNLLTSKIEDLAGLPDAFNDIAQFLTVLPGINDALDALSQVTMDSSSEQIAAASTTLAAYTTMTGNIIKQAKGPGLQVQQHDLHSIISSEGPYPFVVKEGSATINGIAGVLLVSVGITGEVQAAIGVPVITIEDYDTVPYNTDETGFYCYYYKNTKDSSLLPATTGQTITSRTVVLKTLNMLAKQDAAVSVYMDRNADLVPGKPTNRVFVYTTGNVEFPNYYYPNFVRGEAIDIATIPTGKPVTAPLQEQLNNFFDALLKKNKQSKLSFNVVITYDYQVNHLGNKIQLPVMMQPIKTFDLGDHPDKAPEGMIDNWVKVINDWLKENGPNTTNASLNFNVSIFSNLTDEPKPLIQLTNLYLKLANIG